MQEFQALLATHGLWVVALAVLIDQIGLPIPAPPLLVLAGSLIGSGELSAGPTLAAAVLAAIPGDLLWFELGRRKGGAILRLLCRVSLEPDSCVRSTGEQFERHGPGTLIFAKFVPGLQTLAPPLSGATGMSRRRFLSYDIPGALLWSGTFLAGGALLHDEIQRLLEALTEVSTQVGVLALIALAAWIAWKYFNRRRFLHALRNARIEPLTLLSMIEAGEDPAIFDLRSPLQLEMAERRLPGARLISLDALESRHHEIPRDREIILYCA